MCFVAFSFSRNMMLSLSGEHFGQGAMATNKQNDSHGQFYGNGSGATDIPWWRKEERVIESLPGSSAFTPSWEDARVHKKWKLK